MMEHDVEPVRGLPERLPAGERMLWQGSPSFAALATQVFHMRAVAAYFVALLAWSALSALHDGQGWAGIAAGWAWLVPGALIGLGLLGLFAWLYQRSTIYTITNRRVVLRIGVAVPKAINVPYSIVAEAALQKRANGSGDIALTLTGRDRISYAHLWPHVRPWALSDAQPAMRCLPGVETVARTLAEAMVEAKAPAVTAPVPAPAVAGPELSPEPQRAPALANA
jgi:hypothetical protein